MLVLIFTRHTLRENAQRTVTSWNTVPSDLPGNLSITVYGSLKGTWTEYLEGYLGSWEKFIKILIKSLTIEEGYGMGCTVAIYIYRLLKYLPSKC